MPTYSVKCEKCGAADDFISRIANRDDTPYCCGQKTTRQIVAAQISAGMWTGHKGFHMPDGRGQDGVGTWIESGDAYHRYLKDNNKIPASEGVREVELKKASRVKEEDRKLTAAVEKAVLSHTK